MLVKKMLDWADEKHGEALDVNEKHSTRKAMISGAVEGFIDGAVIAYPILLAGCIYWRKKATKK